MVNYIMVIMWKKFLRHGVCRAIILAKLALLMASVFQKKNFHRKHSDSAVSSWQAMHHDDCVPMPIASSYS